MVRGDAVILDVPQFEVMEGEVLSLVGPNGAGKTSLLQTLAYLAAPFSGDIFFRDRKVGHDCTVLEYRRAIAMAFQEPLLFDTTVAQNVASGLRIRGVKGTALSERVAEYLDLFGISHLTDRAARSLSGGEAQRTSLARAFAVKPEAILLDEPFASLDPGSREPLVDDIQKVLEKTKATTVLVTHDLTEALRLSDRIAVMDRGRIHQIGTPDEVMDRPADEMVASFVGANTVIAGVVREKRGGRLLVSVNGEEIESAGDFKVGERVGLYIRPEKVRVEPIPGPGGGGQGRTTTGGIGGTRTTVAGNLFPATVVRIVPMGFYEKVHLDCGFPLIAYVTRQLSEEMGVREGQGALASFEPESVHVIARKGK